jgi:RNA polymerase-binding transcription factor DksA
MDLIDRAEEVENWMREAAITIIAARANDIPKNLSGLCWTCGAPVPDERRWCCAECRDDYERQ